MKDDALKRFLECNTLLFEDYEKPHKGLPYLGVGVENGNFSGYTGKVAEAFDWLGNGIEKLKNEKNRELPLR